MEWQEKAKIMVETQIKSRGIKNPALLEAMAELPRHLFVPKHLSNLAYSDCALPIGEGADDIATIYRGQDDGVA